MTGFIYAVECGGRIKLGWSTKPEFRFSKICSDAPFPCTFIGQWEGGRDDEAALHKKFAAARCYREWFASTKEVLAYCRSKAEPVDFSDRFTIKDDDSPLAVWRKAQRITMDGPAAALGVTKTTWSRWERGIPYPPHWKLGALRDLTGLPASELCDPKYQYLFLEAAE